MEEATRPTTQKKEYTRPLLTDHGTLARLTQGGPSGVTENVIGGKKSATCL
jgi:hypothetical protein